MIQLPSRYAYRRLLGVGGMGEVHLAHDRERERDVAIKVCQPAPGADAAEARWLFRQEFHAMAALSHPHLVAADELGALGDGRDYFSSPYVPGEDLAPGQDEAAVRRWLSGLASALGYLHAQGLVHGDLKPENIRLRTDGQAVLMDLGLLRASGLAGEPVRGTLAYVAPETIQRAAVDGRADLYALGALLFHVLAGHPPYAVPDTIALLRAHLGWPVPDLRHAAPAVSEAMATAVGRLMAKDPADRFQGVGDLLAHLSLPHADDGRAGLFGSPLIGREEAQRAIAEVLEGPADAPRAVHLAGASGMGKSRLLGEARAQAQLLGLPSLFARGLGTGAAPYEALRPWLRALALAAGPEARALARVLPELGLEPLPALEERQEQARFVGAVTELACAQWPEAAFLVDAADRLDQPSRELVDQLRRQHGPRWRWVLASEAGSDEALALAPLAPAAIEAIARALLGQVGLPDAVAERLPTWAAGNPGRAEALLARWVRSGALARRAGRWEATGVPLDLPAGDQPETAGALEGLSDAAGRVARLAGVLGEREELGCLQAVAALGEAAFYAAVAELVRARVIDQSGGRYAFTPPALAALLASGEPDERRRRAHSAAAEWHRERLADMPVAPIESVLALAHHGLAGETPTDAMPWVQAASERAFELFAIDAAVPLLQRALAVAEVPTAARAELQARLAQAWRIQGRTDEAIALLDADVLPHLRASGAANLADQLVSYGLLLQMKSRQDEAHAAFEQAIAEADARGATPVAVRARLASGRLAIFRGDAAGAEARLGEAIAQARASGQLGYLARGLAVYGYHLASTDPARLDEGLACLSEAIATAESAGDRRESMAAQSSLGNVQLGRGDYRAARTAFEANLALCERMGDANEQLFAHLNVSAAMLELGELAGALGHAAEALSLARAQGRRFPEAFALALSGQAQILLGQPASGAVQQAEGLAIARAIQHRYLELHVLAHQTEGLIALGRFAEGRTALAEAEALAASLGNQELRLKLALAEVALAVLERRPEGAAGARALADAAAQSGRRADEAQALRWLGRALADEGRPAEAEAAWRGALEGAEAAGLAGLRAELCESLGRLALSAGDRAAGADHFAAGLALAEATGACMPLWLCAAGLGAARPSESGRREAAARALQGVLDGLDAQARAAYLAWPERAALRAQTAHASGAMTWLEGLDSLGDVPAVLQRVIETYVRLVEAERGFLLLFEQFEVSHEAYFAMGERESDAFSLGVAMRVLWSGETLVLEDASADDELGARNSVQALGLRAVLGVPLGADAPFGVLLAEHRTVAGQFGEAQVERAEAFARQAAFMVRNALAHQRYRDGFDALQRLQRLALPAVAATRLDDVLAPVAHEALALTGAERLLLLQGPSLTASHAFGPEGARTPDDQDLSTSIARWVFENGEPLHLLDAQSDEAYHDSRSVLALGLRTVYAVPVAHAGQRYGVLYLDTRQVAEPDAGALRGLAAMAGLVGAFLARGGGD